MTTGDAKHAVRLPIVLDLRDIDEIEELTACLSQASAVADLMYADFCNYVLNVDFKCVKTFPHGSSEWKAFYYEINRLLRLPV